jgi:hypothetical protein
LDAWVVTQRKDVVWAQSGGLQRYPDGRGEIAERLTFPFDVLRTDPRANHAVEGIFEALKLSGAGVCRRKHQLCVTNALPEGTEYPLEIRTDVVSAFFSRSL